MNVLRWISLLLLLAALVLWGIARYRSASRSTRAAGLLLAGLVLNEVRSFMDASPLAVVLLVLTIPCFVAGGVLTVREARAAWRAEMEKVKHL